jgi:hypothetical protein
MRYGKPTRGTAHASACALLVALAAAGCERGSPFTVGTSTLRIAWPPAAPALEDSATFAVAIFRSTDPAAATATFAASLDGGPAIPGTRRDSVVVFPLAVPTDGEHTLTVQASTGHTAVRTFTRAFVGRPRIRALSADSANPALGDRIVIRGERFSTDPLAVRVYLDGVELPESAPATDSLVVSFPQGLALESGLLAVEVNGRISPDLVPFRIVGSAPSAPRLLHVRPNTARARAPFQVVGRGVGEGDVPFVNGVAAVPLLDVQTQTLPLVGTVTTAVSVVPPGAQRFRGQLEVETSAGRTNAFPFTVP